MRECIVSMYQDGVVQRLPALKEAAILAISVLLQDQQNEYLRIPYSSTPLLLVTNFSANVFGMSLSDQLLTFSPRNPLDRIDKASCSIACLFGRIETGALLEIVMMELGSSVLSVRARALHCIGLFASQLPANLAGTALQGVTSALSSAGPSSMLLRVSAAR